MSFIRSLAGETAVYGVSNILGRILQYLLLTPYLTRIFRTEEYGIHGIMYSFAALLMVVLTYRMETAFFRFGHSETERPVVFSTASISLLLSTLAFVLGLLLFAEPIAGVLTRPGDAVYVVYFAFIVGFDVLAALPFAKLRLENRAYRFAAIKICNILITIVLTLFMLSGCPYLISKGYHQLEAIYDPAKQLDYVFLANLVASGIVWLLLLPEYFHLRVQFSFERWKRMLRYALPLVIVGVAGVVNQLLDRFLLKEWLPGTLDERLDQVGIYNGCVKLAILMNLFIQAFNYAAEPFFFKNAERSNTREIYAEVAQAFALVGSLVFLGIVLYLDLVQYLIGRDYREGLGVVPILLLAYFFLGLYYNFSIWYKVTDRTHIGAWISVCGACITLAVNYLLIPRVGYYGSALAALGCYGFMAAASLLVGRKHYPVPYPLKRIGLYVGVALGGYALSLWLRPLAGDGLGHLVGLNTLLLLGLLGALYFLEKETFARWMSRGG